MRQDSSFQELLAAAARGDVAAMDCLAGRLAPSIQPELQGRVWAVFQSKMMELLDKSEDEVKAWLGGVSKLVIRQQQRDAKKPSRLTRR